MSKIELHYSPWWLWNKLVSILYADNSSHDSWMFFCCVHEAQIIIQNVHISHAFRQSSWGRYGLDKQKPLQITPQLICLNQNWRLAHWKMLAWTAQHILRRAGKSLLDYLAFMHLKSQLLTRCNRAFASRSTSSSIKCRLQLRSKIIFTLTPPRGVWEIR